MLDEFAAVTGYHRKHAIRLLAKEGNWEEKLVAIDPSPGTPSCRRRTYGVEARDALIQLWEVADWVCSKWLRPMVPVLLPALERHGRVVCWMRRRGPSCWRRVLPALTSCWLGCAR